MTSKNGDQLHSKTESDQTQGALLLKHPSMTRLNTRGLLWTFGVGLVLIAIALVSVGAWLTRPAQRLVGPAPPDLPLESVRLVTADNEVVSGWVGRGAPGRGAVLLLHGVRADRRQMLGRARFLLAAGHSVMLVDLPAHGESTGARITFGLREAQGVKAALAHLRQVFPAERIGVIGASLGAASYF